MQTVSAGFTAEETDAVRKITQNLQVSWKKFSTLGNRTFTIGVSTIGGSDVIGINPGAIGSPANYQYFDETGNVLSLGWERGLNMPLGGLSQGLAEGELENTDGRFLPRYMGGSGELFTSILPRRPFIINAGFEVGGVATNLPQFSGTFNRQPEIDRRSSRVKWVGSDYVDFFSNRFVDQETMFTGLRTDEVMTTLSESMGMSTAQYEYDTGINIIPFGIFDTGTRMSHIFNQLAEAENGHFYQDEEGVFRFENRQHWDSAPHDSVSRIIYTADVIDAEAPNEDHIINVVEINSKVYEKQSGDVFTLPIPIEVPASSSVTSFLEFEDPVLALTDPTFGGADSYLVANTLSDGSGTNSTSITVKNLGTFARAVKYRFTNTSSTTLYITDLVLSGRVARHVSDLYYRDQDDSSVTAYEERPVTIENPYIQNATWAASLSKMLLEDYAEIENLQKITVRAKPELQLGDLVSWQGRHWRIYHIRSSLDPYSGYTQELTMLQRDIIPYFRIGISTIGGTDKIGA